MADPTLYDRQKEFKAVSEERSNIEELVQTYKHYKKIKNDLEGAKDLLKSLKSGQVPVETRHQSLFKMFGECIKTIGQLLDLNLSWYQ